MVSFGPPLATSSAYPEISDSGFYAMTVVVEGKEMVGVNGLRTQSGNPLEVNFATPQEQEPESKRRSRKWAPNGRTSRSSQRNLN
jgi:hypothetical protein